MILFFTIAIQRHCGLYESVVRLEKCYLKMVVIFNKELIIFNLKVIAILNSSWGQSLFRNQ